MVSQRGPDDTSPVAVRDDQLSPEYPRASQSSTPSSATTDPQEEPSTGSALPGECSGGGAERGASGMDTDASHATTCDTVSATMWFDRPEVATSFVTCQPSDDDDDDTANSNNYNDEDGKAELFRFCVIANVEASVKMPVWNLHCAATDSSFLRQNFMPLGEEITLEEKRQ